MSRQVDAILQQIERLDSENRLLLRERLSELAESEWQSEAEKARTIAAELGVDQQTIDKAVEDIRYGS
jgi:hypothetical protein